MLTVEPSRNTTFPSRRAEAARPSLEIVLRSAVTSPESATRREPLAVLVSDESDDSFMVDALLCCSQLNGLVVAGQEMYQGFRGVLVEGAWEVAEISGMDARKRAPDLHTITGPKDLTLKSSAFASALSRWHERCSFLSLDTRITNTK